MTQRRQDPHFTNRLYQSAESNLNFKHQLDMAQN
jgi:hypothetical protein